MGNNIYRMTDDEYAIFARKYPMVTRSDMNKVEELLTQKMYADMASHAQTSEIELLKSKALGAMGTEQEMNFSDIESGMLRASLSDGRQALKEIMERTPVEAPSCGDSTKMSNQGREKKNIMTTLGVVKGVGRARYRDEIDNVNVYPLDEKIGLLTIGGRHSRYTGNFACLSAEFYARMPERDALELLGKTLNIELEQASLTSIGAAVAQPYLPKPHDESGDTDEVLHPVTNGQDFIEKRIQEIDNSPDRESIIEKALEEGAEGAGRRRTESDKSVAYVEADGTGVSGLPRELSDKGKSGGPAKTFEAKIGVMFSQSFDSGGLPLLKNGRIFRDPDSTQYMGTVEKAAQFTMQLDAFTRMYGIGSADQVVFLSDGAIWLEKLRLKLFPNSIGIIDLFHAREHLYKLVDSLCFYKKNTKTAFYEECSRLLDLGDIDSLVSLVSQKTTKSNKDDIDKQLGYFSSNKEKMRYGLFRAAGLFIGSGVVESACKTIVENRLNGSGMRWTKKNAANVIALRCAIYSDKYGSAVA